MVTHSQQSWQSLLTQGIKTLEELLTKLRLSPKDLPPIWQGPSHFPLRLPQDFVARMKAGDPQDPLLLQVLPQQVEQTTIAGYSPDPLAEQQAIKTPGLLHKYPGRVLVITTQACAIHCRYCFRREFPYTEHLLSKQQWQTIIDYIRQDPTIHEVILSGGDPLVLSDRRLQQLIDSLDTIKHVTTLRFHSRLPVILPQRITTALVEILKTTTKRVVMVCHSNHPNEIDQSVTRACETLVKAGVTVLNQSVLLAHVNDQLDTLVRLSQTLFQAHILPYYLHLPDRVQGSAHFAVEKDRAQILHQQLRAHLPGYLVPQLVMEVPGEQSKLPL